MPARDQSYEVIGNGRHMQVPYDQRDAFEYGGYAGGADDARGGMWNQSQKAQQRQGPVVNTSQGGADFARALADRNDQQYLSGYLRNVAVGGSTAQQRQLATATADSQAQQRSLAASGRGFGAMAGADRNAAFAAQNVGMAGQQQLAIQRAQDMADARDQLAAQTASIRSQDARERGLYQQASWDQARLSDDQRAQNDAMARFYLNERYKVGQDQLNANTNYERQASAYRTGQSNLDWAMQQQRDAQNDQQTAAAMKMTGDAGALAMSMKDDDDRRYR